MRVRASPTPPCATSSIGGASGLHPEGSRFESSVVHQARLARRKSRSVLTSRCGVRVARRVSCRSSSSGKSGRLKPGRFEARDLGSAPRKTLLNGRQPVPKTGGPKRAGVRFLRLPPGSPSSAGRAPACEAGGAAFESPGERQAGVAQPGRGIRPRRVPVGVRIAPPAPGPARLAQRQRQPP